MIIPQVDSPEYYASLLLDGEGLYTIHKGEKLYAKLCYSSVSRKIIIYDRHWTQVDSMAYTHFITRPDFIVWYF